MKNRKDNYPTRKGDSFSLISRTCKVSKTEIENYVEDGYLIIKSFFTKQEISELKQSAEKIYNGQTDCFINKEPKINQVRSALAVHSIPEIKTALNERLLSIAKSVLGDKIYIHQSRINYKSGMDANGWNWHSDFETWHSKDGMPNMNCFTCMVAIDDNTIENGCLKVIPKSHTEFISCPKVGNLDPNSEFSEQVEGVPSDEMIGEVTRMKGAQITDIVCNSGDIVLFDCNLLHSSGTNSTTEKRTNLYFVFNAEKNKLQKPFSDSKHRPEEMGATKITLLGTNIDCLKTIAKRTKPVKQHLNTFLNRYESLFALIRHMPLTILEIGVGGFKDPNKGGGSLRMWAEYFPNATIVGLDINPKEIPIPDNVGLHCGSQTDTELLNSLANKYGGFDIVIDDASHITANTITTFNVLWDNVRMFYIIEDLHMKTAIGTKEHFKNIAGADFETTNLCVIKK